MSEDAVKTLLLIVGIVILVRALYTYALGRGSKGRSGSGLFGSWVVWAFLALIVLALLAAQSR